MNQLIALFKYFYFNLKEDFNETISFKEHQKKNHILRFDIFPSKIKNLNRELIMYLLALWT